MPARRSASRCRGTAASDRNPPMKRPGFAACGPAGERAYDLSSHFPKSICVAVPPRPELDAVEAIGEALALAVGALAGPVGDAAVGTRRALAIIEVVGVVASAFAIVVLGADEGAGISFESAAAIDGSGAVGPADVVGDDVVTAVEVAFPRRIVERIPTVLAATTAR